MRGFLLALVVGLISCTQYPTEDLLGAKFFEIDTNPPKILVPQDSVVKENYFIILFSQPMGATRFFIEISLKEDFSVLLDNFPKTITTNYYLFEGEAENTYYFRVRANTTRANEYSPILRFHFLKDTLYVYCPQEVSNCSTNEGFGTKQLPFRNPVYAMNKAIELNIREIRIARRGGNAAYFANETLTINHPLKIKGGYHPESWEYNPQVHVTRIENSLFDTIRVQYTQSSQEYGIFGFHIKNLATTLTRYTIYAVGTSGKFTIGENVITGGSSNDNYGIYLKDGNAIISKNTILGGTGTSNNTAIQLNNATAEILNNHITGGSGGNSWGIYAENNSVFSAKENTIIAATAGNNARGISLVSGADTFSEDNFISGGTAISQTRAITIGDQNSIAYIQRNKIMGGTGNQNYGISITQGNLKAFNNLISVKGNTSYAIDISLSTSQPAAHIFNNTIYVQGNNSYGVYLNFGSSNQVHLDNNIILGENQTNNICVFENNTNDLFSFKFNNLQGCQNRYRDHDGDANRNIENDLNDSSLTCNSGGCATGNKVLAVNFVNFFGSDNNAYTLLDNNWQLHATSDCHLRYGAKNRSGFFTNDFLKIERTAVIPTGCTISNQGDGWSMGAYEFFE